MAELFSLEEDLTCSICLSTFVCPVTIPCGHNFCQDCLLASWVDCSSFCCPQCRATFLIKPDLKKNTVLSTIVENFNSKLQVQSGGVSGEQLKPEQKGILCDTCMEAEASKTCLTCMASFCEQHLKPHQMNPVFSLHQLTNPVANLLEWICQSHHKLMEFFCSQHGQAICSLCLQQNHKGCSFISTEEQRNLKKAYFKEQLDFLDIKLTQNQTVLVDMSRIPQKMKDCATSRKKAIAAEYQLIRDLLAEEEQKALLVLDQEVENSHLKMKVLTKKFTANIGIISKAREDLQSELSRTHTLAFLKAPFDPPKAATFDPYIPRITVDSTTVKLSKDFAASLKKYLTETFTLPLEARLPRLKTAEHAGLTEAASAPGPKPGPLTKQKKKKAVGRLTENPSRVPFTAAASKQEAGAPPLDVTSVLERSELLKYCRALTLDRTTAHKRIAMSHGYTKASNADQPLNYPDCPQRFTVCSQVLAAQGFSRGRHYWEILLSSNNFIGIGLTYPDIERAGLASRLGRNSLSWCVEWLNNKLSAWHNSIETVLENPSPQCVGVLLDWDGGTATFYKVADKATPFHCFVFPFERTVYPAFWVFPSGSSMSLRPLQA